MLNRVVCENTDAASFITFFWGVLDPESGRFTYVNAGHNPPRLVRPGAGLELLESGGLILGVLPDASYDEGDILITPGDALVLYTDGVTEARNADDEEYDETRLDAALLQHCGYSADDCLNALRTDVEAFIDGKPYTDDVTILVLKAVAV
ncbi:MAG: serine/threonine-protein phosphatase, partial [Bacteroidetes bacterium]|nr:serine/threonine-protein phosphatase [Bacteroidota bacterium]